MNNILTTSICCICLLFLPGVALACNVQDILKNEAPLLIYKSYNLKERPSKLSKSSLIKHAAKVLSDKECTPSPEKQYILYFYPIGETNTIYAFPEYISGADFLKRMSNVYFGLFVTDEDNIPIGTSIKKHHNYPLSNADCSYAESTKDFFSSTTTTLAPVRLENSDVYPKGLIVKSTTISGAYGSTSKEYYNLRGGNLKLPDLQWCALHVYLIKFPKEPSINLDNGIPALIKGDTLKEPQSVLIVDQIK